MLPLLCHATIIADTATLRHDYFMPPLPMIHTQQHYFRLRLILRHYITTYAALLPPRHVA